MTEKAPINGRETGHVPAHRSARHRRDLDTSFKMGQRTSEVHEQKGRPQSRTVVEVTISMRYPMLEALNQGFLNDTGSTKFSEYARKVIEAGLRALANE